MLSCKGGIGDKNSVAKIMAKKCQCVVYASSYPYGLSYRYDKKKKDIIYLTRKSSDGHALRSELCGRRVIL